MRKKAITKETLLEIANNIIINEDLKSCTIRNISKHAEIGVGTIYNYFPSQKDLMEQVFVYSWRVTIGRLQQAIQIDSEDKIYNFLVILNKEVENRKGLGSVVFSGNSSHINDTVFKQITELFEQLLIENGVDKSISPTLSPTLLFGLVNKNINTNLTTKDYYEKIVIKHLK